MSLLPLAIGLGRCFTLSISAESLVHTLVPNHCLESGYSLSLKQLMLPSRRAFQHLCGLQGSDSDPATVARLTEAIRARSPVQVELINIRKDGTRFWCAFLHQAPAVLTCLGVIIKASRGARADCMVLEWRA